MVASLGRADLGKFENINIFHVGLRYHPSKEAVKLKYRLVQIGQSNELASAGPPEKLVSLQPIRQKLQLERVGLAASCQAVVELKEDIISTAEEVPTEISFQPSPSHSYRSGAYKPGTGNTHHVLYFRKAGASRISNIILYFWQLMANYGNLWQLLAIFQHFQNLIFNT